MKYKEIYKIIYASDCTQMNDRSYWHKPQMDIVERNRPLWIILENKRVNLRLWVTHEYGELRITTAQLDLPCNSREYNESHKRYKFKTQAEMAAGLKKILDGGKTEGH